MSNKRDLVLKATLDLISEHGFHDTSMSMISKTSGVSPGTIYHYFTGKEELVTVLYIETKLSIIKAVLDGYSEDIPIKKRFYNIWNNNIDFNNNNQSVVKYIKQFENSPYIKPVLGEKFMKAIQPFFSFFEEGIRLEIFKSLPPIVLFELSFGVGELLVKRSKEGIVKLDKKLVQTTAEASWDAITL